MLALDPAVPWQMEHQQRQRQASPSPPASTPSTASGAEKSVRSTHPTWQQPFQRGAWPEIIIHFLPLSAGNGKSIRRVIHPPSSGRGESPSESSHLPPPENRL